MTLISGTRLGAYEILNPLGKGGMGEVYRARDTRLDRTVAIKVLASHLSDSPDLRQRFEREARTIASLNHPHICVLHDIGQQEGLNFLVMEYLEGESLTQRLAKGGLPFDQVLRYAIEIADALDKAHRQGIIHRDLKPGNIMITKSGAKLLDFGLAKLRGPEPPVSGVSELPTQSPTLTVEGTILGTFQYMAPEQLEGKEADARTDIFAFGAVVYEMATGRKAFEGKSQASIIAAIMEHHPAPISAIKPMTPPVLDRVVKKCLAKQKDVRWQTAQDLLDELKWIAEESSRANVPSAISQVAIPRKSRMRLAWALMGVVLLAAVLLTWALQPRLFREAKETDRISFVVLPPEKATFASLGPAAGPVVVSPDGRRLAFVATLEGKQVLWVRPLNTIFAQALPGTEGASYPFWSPDSRYIGFFANGKLKRIEASGGPPQTLCDAPAGRGGAWSREGVIIFAPNVFDALYRVPEAGGQPGPVTNLDRTRGETTHRWPSFLPDSRRFVYFARSSLPENQGIYLGSLDSGKTQRLISGRSNALYASPGYLLFVREGTLVAQPFDVNDHQVKDEAFPVVEKVGYDVGTDRGAFSVSEQGVLAYASGTRGGASRLAWFDRQGKMLGFIDPPDTYLHLALSRDDKKVALERRDPETGNPDVWLLEFSRGVRSRFTFDPSFDGAPNWCGGERQIIFFSNREGVYDLYQKVPSGVGKEELVLKSNITKVPTDCSLDGRFVAYQSLDPKTKWDVWALQMFGDRKPVPLAQTEFDETHAQFSPDGRWVAYVSNETGTPEVYVVNFPLSGGKWQVSTGGGTQPKWGRDGKELFYLSLDRKVMAVEIHAGSNFATGLPKTLFEVNATGAALGRYYYDATVDGERFLVNTELHDTASSPVTVVLNWTVGLKR